MGYAQTITPQKGLFFGLFSNYSEVRAEQIRRRRYANTVRGLESLSDRLLEDIGIPRNEIRQRAYDSVYLEQPCR